MARANNMNTINSGLKQNLAGGFGNKQYGPPLPNTSKTSNKSNPLPGINLAGGVGNDQYGPPVPSDIEALNARKPFFKNKEQLGNVSKAARNIAVITNTGQDRLQRVPIPGGVWLPLSILLLLMFVLVPVNGHTRIVWFFLAIAGLAHIEGSSHTLTDDSQKGLDTLSGKKIGSIDHTIKDAAICISQQGYNWVNGQCVYTGQVKRGGGGGPDSNPLYGSAEAKVNQSQGYYIQTGWSNPPQLQTKEYQSGYEPYSVSPEDW